MTTRDSQISAPPPGITLTCNADGVRIVISTAVNTLWKVIFWLSPLAFMICLGSVASLLGRHVRHRRLFDPLLIEEIPALLLLAFSGFASLCWCVTTFARPRLIWNSHHFRVEKVPRWLKIPAREILAFNAVEDTRQRVYEVDFSRNALNPFRRAPRTGLEIHVPAGRIRILDGIGAARVHWLADQLNRLAGLPSCDSQTADDDLMAYAASSRITKPIALGGVLVGIAMSVSVVCNLVPGLRSLSWPSVNGLMTSSSFTGHGAGLSASYLAAVRYHYSVNGKQYVSDHLSFGFSPADDLEVRQLIHAHPKGASIRVYYNPARPEQSVLLTGVGGMTALLGVASVFAVVLCVLCIYPILKRKTPSKAQMALIKRYAITPPRKGRSYPVMP
ncbi:MAG TPA: DUF3592 domain-containing protein [Tepidisphaeraceae bacterium]|nr:DUF3592 domain-containing protein [Tepidisphaeraceae bacterium]